MKTLYLDCSMGAAGDMLTAALLELMPDQEKCIEEINSLNIPKVKVKKEISQKCGINGTHFSVIIDGVEEESHDVDEHSHNHDHGEHHHCDHDHGEHHHCDHDHGEHHDCDHDHGEHHHCDHDHEEHHDCHHDHGEHHHCDHDHGEHHDCHHDHGEHHDCHHDHGEHHHCDHDHGEHHHHNHSSLNDINNIIKSLNIPEKVKKDAMEVYELIAEAESKAHGMPVTEIHFHEVGTMDAVADIVSFCLLINKLSPDEIIATPVHVGSGHVHCAHGILPVPAPATAYILKDVPIYGGKIKGELCTPTGAALLKHFVTKFGDMPVMSTEKIGYGMGKKDFEQANCIRAILGESKNKCDEILELSFNADDMTGEKIGYAMEKLFEAGALDVYTIPIGMKKSRPGILMRVMCREADKENLVKIIFKHTTTIGIRENKLNRYVLKREIKETQTKYGTVKVKISSGYGVTRSKYEYDDLAKIADSSIKSIYEIEEELNEEITNMQ